MAKNQKKIMPIDYTSREYQSIRKDLLEIAERLYPDSFQDFSEASFGSIMIDSVAYVADQLSFYMDYNVNESFLDTAYQFNNVLRHGRALGYKYQGRPSTYGTVALYVIVPASVTSLGPDGAYLPILKRGTTFSSESGLNFVLTENVDFADPKYPVVVARTDPATGAPTYFAVKAYGSVVSGIYKTEQIKVGAYERYKSVALSTPNVTEVISVFDSEGNEFFEVDYLAQDTVYKEIKNSNYKNDNVPSILKPLLVSRKFSVERDLNSTVLQFGSGKVNESNVVGAPQSVAMDIFGKTYITDTTFDPSRLSQNESFGLVPQNTTLTVTVRTTNPRNSNVAAGQLNEVNGVEMEFEDRTLLNESTINTVIASLEVYNETPIMGDVSNPNSDEIKQRIYDTFPTQNRAVTQADYESLTYRMPPKFGSIKRVSTQKDPDSQKRNLNIYVVSEDSFGKLTKTNSTIKRNLKVWLNQHRMINDTIDILDPFIINLGIEFVIKAMPGADKYLALDACVDALREHYGECPFIGEPLYLSDVYSALKNAPGVLDVVTAKFVNKTGTNYSSATIDINRNMSPDGDYLMIPLNAVAEIKFPETDIKGKVR